MTVQTEQTAAAFTQRTAPAPAPDNEQVLTGWAQILGHALDHSNEKRPPQRASAGGRKSLAGSQDLGQRSPSTVPDLRPSPRGTALCNRDRTSPPATRSK